MHILHVSLQLWQLEFCTEKEKLARNSVGIRIRIYNCCPRSKIKILNALKGGPGPAFITIQVGFSRTQF